MIEIWTDGSSRKNGKPECFAGWAMAATVQGKTFVRYGYLPPPSSNNKGEIMGVLYAMHLFHKSNLGFRFFSDSKYVVLSINQWRHKHKLTGFDGISNTELLLPLYSMWDAHGKSTIEWVKGHAGIKGNELADEFAGLGADQRIRNIKNETSDILYIPPETLPEQWLRSSTKTTLTA